MRRKREKPNTVSMAGWLFADLLLGVAMLFFVFNTVGEAPESPPVDTPSPRPTSTPTLVATSTLFPTASAGVTPVPTPTGVHVPPGVLDPDPQIVEILTDGDRLLGYQGDDRRREEERRIVRIVRSQLPSREGQGAGMVMSFGGTWTSDPSRGRRLAEAVNELLREEIPKTFEGTVFEAFHYLTSRSEEIGLVELRIYWALGEE